MFCKQLGCDAKILVIFEISMDFCHQYSSQDTEIMVQWLFVPSIFPLKFFQTVYNLNLTRLHFTGIRIYSSENNCCEYTICKKSLVIYIVKKITYNVSKDCIFYKLKRAQMLRNIERVLTKRYFCRQLLHRLLILTSKKNSNVGLTLINGNLM